MIFRPNILICTVGYILLYIDSVDTAVMLLTSFPPLKHLPHITVKKRKIIQQISMKLEKHKTLISDHVMIAFIATFHSLCRY